MTLCRATAATEDFHPVIPVQAGHGIRPLVDIVLGRVLELLKRTMINGGRVG